MTPTTELTHAVRVRVNGVPYEAAVPARRLLSDFLRHDLGLTGTHVGCEHGVCGCCTVLLDGAPVRSCLLLAVTVAGHELTTVEGCTEADGSLGPVQQAFRECHGLQCGFCTPGFVTTISAYLKKNPNPTLTQVKEACKGNFCRCGTYPHVFEAALAAAKTMAMNTPGAASSASEEA